MDDLATTATAVPPTAATTGSRVMHLLEGHVPISLLADLSDPHGPRSAEILDAEGGPETAWWRS